MKILFVSKSSPFKEGGAETRTREVVRQLTTLGHEVDILCARVSLDDAPLRVIGNVTLICKKVVPDWIIRKYPYPHYLPLAAASLLLMLYLPGVLKKKRYEVIREEIAPFPSSGMLSLCRLGAARRIAVTYNLPGTFANWRSLYGPIYGLAGYLMERLLRAGKLQYDRIVCDSTWFAEELRQHATISNRVTSVANGVSPAFFQERVRKRRDGDEIRLLSVGRLVEHKGHQYLVEALSLLRDLSPRIKLTILGNGPLKERLLETARKFRVADQVEFRPPVIHEDLPKVYTEYDIFVMPSISEGHPMALLEAMASKLPIVAADIPGINRILDERSATLCRPRDPGALAEKLKWVIANLDEAERRCERAYEEVKKYDWSAIAIQEIQI